MNVEVGRYRHTQKGPWGLLLYVLAVVFLTVSWYAPLLPLQVTFLITGILMFPLGPSLGHLVVEDEGDRLFIHFGPLPLFQKRIRYDDIREVGKGRLPFHESGGIHWSPWNGWVWSVWGYDCVVIRLKRRVVRVGTDDPDGLLAFLKGRIAGERASE